jgi:acyl-CoA thioester hydrolase
VISAVELRVNYSETDQMGVVYHANYLVWLDRARTEHLRDCGMSYRELEALGFFLTVVEARVRYRRPARYDDLLRVRCWVRERNPRRVIFGYAVERTASDQLLATAETALIALNRDHELTRLPEKVCDLLEPTADPVRLF